MRAIYIGLIGQQSIATAPLARALLPKKSMRTAFILVIIAVLPALYYWQHHQPAKPGESAGAVTAQTPLSQPTQSPQTSQVNWMKRSIDRAQDVARKARTQTTESQDP
jgi:hypothetical protein